MLKYGQNGVLVIQWVTRQNSIPAIRIQLPLGVTHITKKGQLTVCLE